MPVPHPDPTTEIARLAAQGLVSPSSGSLPERRDGPRVTVAGVGELRRALLPLQVEDLVALAEPAPFGKGEDTLVDARVRDTWRVPSSLVNVEWDGALDQVLDEARATLALPPQVRLRAEFHSMLVYTPGQFFAPHQDSQKHEAMVATLVVMLPASGTGGELIVYGPETAARYEASRFATRLVAFYADRRHEVRPVRTGHRVTLTYNLLLDGDASAQDVPEDVADDLAHRLCEYFEAPPEHRSREGEPVTRLAYLLDHEYTPATLSMRTLKGGDAGAVARLVDAATRADCEVALALAEVRELRAAWHEDHTGDLITDAVTITHVLGDDGKVDETSLFMGSDVAAATPSSHLAPYDSHYQGFMGNDGNTRELWYRRGALLIAPRRLAFANCAKTAPGASLRRAMVGLTEQSEKAREDLRELVPSWPGIVRAQMRGRQVRDSAADLLYLCAAIAAYVDDADIARGLLAPFSIEHLRPAAAGELLGVASRHGDDLVVDLMGGWAGEADEFPRGWRSAEWVSKVPELVRAFSRRPVLARRVVQLAVAHVTRVVEDADAERQPRDRAARMALLSDAAEAMLWGLGRVGDVTLRAEVVTWCTRGRLDAVIPALMRARSWSKKMRDGAGIDALTQAATTLLSARLATPERDPGDWSIPLPEGCSCDLCMRLSEFLTDPKRTSMEWPLKAELRRHVCARIEGHDLPVDHTTRRQGRPFVLVLAKNAALQDLGRATRTDTASWLETLDAS
ncbi:MAG: 2OG-Fe(II) oxygenase [Mobilicoccus sp.]|nr:2OG-Fe(II) oxygenase [Mobilicoccus sp.]